MKNFNWKAFQAYRYDIKVNRDDMKDYYPHVINLANSFPRDSIAIGVLNIQDLIQAGNISLVEAWAKVDWDRIDKSPNPQAELWSYLKKRIKFGIRQHINTHANAIRIPTRDLKESSKNMTSHEKIIVNVFANFFDKDRYLMYVEDVGPWKSLQLESLIDDALNKCVHNVDHRDILKKFYGIGYEKHSQKILAEQYRLTPSNIQTIVSRIREKLNNNEFKLTIENFYKN